MPKCLAPYRRGPELIPLSCLSRRQAKSKTPKQASAKENLYILASGACTCSTAAGLSSKRDQLKQGDLFGATRYLLDRIPEISCLCPFFFRFWPICLSCHISVLPSLHPASRSPLCLRA
jgi:hypothetical protein